MIKSNLGILRGLLVLSLITLFTFSSYAEKIYVMNGGGYNSAEPQLITAITNNGHTVTVNSTNMGTLPSGFTTYCNDPVNGYDWLCFFGTADFAGLGMAAQIQAFIDAGGKVFYQYEVTCCTTSSTSVASISSDITGLTITPNAAPYIAIGSTSNGGYEATNISCCASFIGNAYKGLDGLPLANQIQATATVAGATPPISTCLNFGFTFATTDFVGTANSGAIIGIGDINLWYDGGEPFSNGGSTPVNTSMVDYIFPNSSSTCYAFPQGCVDTNNYNPSQSAQIINLGNDTNLCQGETLLLNASTSGSTYLWQDNSTNSTFNITQAGTYWVQISGGCGISTDTIVVSFNQTTPFTFDSDTTLCQGESLLLDVNSLSGTYLWQDNSTNPSFDVIQQGSYWVQITSGCGIISDTINVNFNPILPINLNLGNDTILCQSQTLLLDVTSPNATYLWQDNSTNPTFNITQQGTYWVQITGGCRIVSDTINVSFILEPLINLGNDTILCQGESLLLDANIPNSSYLWQDNSTNSSFNITQQGSYWVQITGSCGTISDTIIATFNPLPTINFGNDSVLCQGESLLLDASSPNATYLWQDNSTNPTFNITQLGTYWVIITNSCGIISDTINTAFNPSPVVNLGNDTMLCDDESLSLDVSLLNATYLWQDNSTIATSLISQEGTYWVTVSLNNCNTSDTLIVNENICEIILQIPNVLTPNNDGFNDIFTPIVSKGIISMSTVIFNRWGNQIFETNEFSINWDFKDVSDGTYYWIVNYIDINDEDNTLKGYVTIFR